jgi:guanylate kinase
MNKKKIIVITAPSGAGKTSIVQSLLNKYPALGFSISAATRTKRENEIHGKDYYFLTPETFQQHIENNDFIEWEMVYEGKYYGTLKSEIQRLWHENKTPILDIDVKGAIHVQKQFLQNCITIFIAPPSVEELKKRLQSRGTETEEMIATRVNKASYEMSFQKHFNYTVVNTNLETAIIEVEKIIEPFIS